jgi:hypothetical protein
MCADAECTSGGPSLVDRAGIQPSISAQRRSSYIRLTADAQRLLEIDRVFPEPANSPA